ncbi:HNH endonuclease [Streptomyces griseoincarnatus]
MAVSKRLRFEVLRRDNHTCRYCGATSPTVPLRVDHVTPVALGGTDTPDNLVTACEPCNSGKSSATADNTVVAAVADDAFRWADAMKQAAETLRAQEGPKHSYRESFQSAWNEWKWEHRGKRSSYELPQGWKTSLESFRLAGLPEWVWPDIVEVAMTRQSVRPESKFKYCCGIAWKKVGALQEEARRLVSPEPASGPADPLVEAFVTIWEHAWNDDLDEEAAAGPVSDTERSKFRQSVEKVLKDPWYPYTTPDRDDLLIASCRAGLIHSWDVQAGWDCLQRERLDEVYSMWSNGYAESCLYPGPSPDTAFTEVIEQAQAVLGRNPLRFNGVSRAALFAGLHQSTVLHFTLREGELAETQVDKRIEMAADLWARSFAQSAGYGPSAKQRQALKDSLERLRELGERRPRAVDVFIAASTAGAYQDPDLTTCLPRNLSALEAAGTPVTS